MPRTRQTQSGDRAQAQQSGMPGVRYGEGQDLRELQSALPTPNARAGRVPSPPSPGSAPQAPLPTNTLPSGGVPPSPSIPKPGLLLAPTTRSGEALTHGLNRGPGAGPEVLGVNPVESPTGRFLRDLARITGRDSFAELARRSGL